MRFRATPEITNCQTFLLFRCKKTFSMCFDEFMLNFTLYAVGNEVNVDGGVGKPKPS